jgi:hypothetical protein
MSMCWALRFHAASPVHCASVHYDLFPALAGTMAWARVTFNLQCLVLNVFRVFMHSYRYVTYHPLLILNFAINSTRICACW